MAPKKKPATKKKGGKYAGIPGASRFSKEKLDKVYISSIDEAKKILKNKTI